MKTSRLGRASELPMVLLLVSLFAAFSATIPNFVQDFNALQYPEPFRHQRHPGRGADLVSGQQFKFWTSPWLRHSHSSGSIFGPSFEPPSNGMAVGVLAGDAGRRPRWRPDASWSRSACSTVHRATRACSCWFEAPRFHRLERAPGQRQLLSAESLAMNRFLVGPISFRVLVLFIVVALGSPHPDKNGFGPCLMAIGG